MLDQKCKFETSKVYTIRLQQYRDSKILFCGKTEFVYLGVEFRKSKVCHTSAPGGRIRHYSYMLLYFL